MRRMLNRRAIGSLIALILGTAFGTGGGCDESYYYYPTSGYGDDWSYISDDGYGSSNGDYSDAISTYLGNFVSYQ
jgi:hypothetical protein